MLYSIPLLGGLFFYDTPTKTSLFILASIPQVFFVLMEYFEIKITGLSKYTEGNFWNKVDVLFTLTFIGHVFYYYWGNVEEK